ncbi:MAG TPA: RNA methyltransferase [Flavobacteriaceae bacterium]|nr:RNA methyltransferase [Flavobacteriaceae bacterium]
MVGKNKIKLINSLSQKKKRLKNKLFIAEGKKTIDELLNSGFELELLLSETLSFEVPSGKMELVSPALLKKVSQLVTPQKALALFKIPEPRKILENELLIALDGVRDPGNLGTIIRLCDWFGVSDLVCSEDTVDCYNPKVVQATMGSIARVNVVYTDLKAFLKVQKTVFGTFMSGENVYETTLSKKGVLVLGNEANGISEEIKALTTKKLAIPQFGEQKNTESLNVATATAILLSEFKRR